MSQTRAELLRYIVNGLAATVVHYSFLQLNLLILNFPSAGLANFVASFFGIAASFIGSRHYVFRQTQQNIGGQASRFTLLYGSTAILHGLILYGWTDFFGLNVTVGFVLATALQVSVSFFGNKFLVFKT